MISFKMWKKERLEAGRARGGAGKFFSGMKNPQLENRLRSAISAMGSAA